MIEKTVKLNSPLTSMTVPNKFRIETLDDATWILTCAFIIFTMQSGEYNCIGTDTYIMRFVGSLNACFSGMAKLVREYEQLNLYL